LSRGKFRHIVDETVEMSSLSDKFAHFFEKREEKPLILKRSVGLLFLRYLCPRRL